MADFTVTYIYEDANGGTTSKQFEGDFLDFAAASAAAIALYTPLAAASTAAIVGYTISQRLYTASVAAAGSNVFERAAATVELTTNNKLSSFSIPSPVPELFIGNTLDYTLATWTDITDQFADGVWTISDGEHITGTKRGKRVFARSGNTNLV